MFIDKKNQLGPFDSFLSLVLLFYSFVYVCVLYEEVDKKRLIFKKFYIDWGVLV